MLCIRLRSGIGKLAGLAIGANFGSEVRPKQLMLSANATQIAIGGFQMTHDVPPQAAPGDDALAGAPEPWESWETRLVLGSIAVGAVGLVALGWLVARFILP